MLSQPPLERVMQVCGCQTCLRRVAADDDEARVPPQTDVIDVAAVGRLNVGEIGARRGVPYLDNTPVRAQDLAACV